MFQPARWKAYLKNLNNAENGNAADDGDENIYHIYHSQTLWFTRDEANGHHEDAEAHLKRCDDLMKDCTTKVDELEETLANTPKPSECLDWCSIW